MDITSVESVCDLLARGRLLAPDEARELGRRWAREGGAAAADGVAFVRWLVVQKHLTVSQAQLLKKFKADGFYLGEYKLLDRVGRGRTAGVYKAAHALGQHVAIKLLPPSKARNSEALDRFQHGGRLAMRLRHPNVVRTFQVGEDDGLHFLVMEYLEGETLGQVLKKRGKLAPAEAVSIVYQALQGLQALHEEAIVHRDLSPANLMLLPGGAAPPHQGPPRVTVKLLAVGPGRDLLDRDAASADEGPAADEVVGDPDYMAPEQARDAQAADIRADIYSLGCVLYHALTGQPPFPDVNPVRKMARHASEAPRPVQAFNPEVPDGLQQILDWMLAKGPADRYPTPERAAQALEVFLAAGSVPKPPAAPAPAPAVRPLPPKVPPVAAPAGPAPAEVNVELVPVAPPKAAPQPPPAGGGGGVEIGRRDFVFLLVGIGGALLAVLFGFLLRWWLRRGKPAEGDNQP